MTDGTFAMVLPKFAIVAADMCQISSLNSWILMQEDLEKMRNVTDSQLISCIGEESDTWKFSEYVVCRSLLYRMQNGYGLSTKATANFACNYLADNLRTANALQVTAILAGYESNAPELYAIDSMGSMHKVKKVCAHGYGGYIVRSILDKSWRSSLTEEQAYDVFKECVTQIQHRLSVNIPNFSVRVVDAYGVKTLPSITVTSLAIERHENRLCMDDTI